MGRTIENKQKIVTEIKSLLDDSEMAVVLDYKGLTIKEMSDLRSRLQTNNGICMSVMPGARMFKIVTITLMEPIIEEIPIK